MKYCIHVQYNEDKTYIYSSYFADTNLAITVAPSSVLVAVAVGVVGEERADPPTVDLLAGAYMFASSWPLFIFFLKRILLLPNQLDTCWHHTTEQVFRYKKTQYYMGVPACAAVVWLKVGQNRKKSIFTPSFLVDYTTMLPWLPCRWLIGWKREELPVWERGALHRRTSKNKHNILTFLAVGCPRCSEIVSPWFLYVVKVC